MWGVWSPDIPFNSGDDNLLFCQVGFDQPGQQGNTEEGVEDSHHQEDLQADPELEEWEEEENGEKKN